MDSWVFKSHRIVNIDLSLYILSPYPVIIVVFLLLLDWALLWIIWSENNNQKKCTLLCTISFSLLRGVLTY